MGFVQSYITKKSVRKKNRIDKLLVSLFSFASLFSASFVIIIVVIVSLKGLNPFLLSYEGFNNVDFDYLRSDKSYTRSYAGPSS